MPFYSRKPTRIPGYDYSTNNYYFITICTFKKQCIFGLPDKLNALGKIAHTYMLKIEEVFTGVKVEKFVIMPNHIHAIIVIDTDDYEKRLPTVSTIIGQFKMSVTKSIREICPNAFVWQRSFHDHIIRNQKDYENIWNYIEANPQKWEEDCFYEKKN